MLKGNTKTDSRDRMGSPPPLHSDVPKRGPRVKEVVWTPQTKEEECGGRPKPQGILKANIKLDSSASYVQSPNDVR